MKLKFLIDQNISIKTAEFLKTLGLEIYHLSNVGLYGKPDEYIYAYSRNKNFILVTFDQEFAYNFISKKDLVGLIILKIHPQTLEHVNKTLKSFFDKVKEIDIKNNLVIIETHRIRIKKIKQD